MTNTSDGDLFIFTELIDARRPWSKKKALKHLKPKEKPTRKPPGRPRPSR